LRRCSRNRDGKRSAFTDSYCYRYRDGNCNTNRYSYRHGDSDGYPNRYTGVANVESLDADAHRYR